MRATHFILKVQEIRQLVGEVVCSHHSSQSTIERIVCSCTDSVPCHKGVSLQLQVSAGQWTHCHILHTDATHDNHRHKLNVVMTPHAMNQSFCLALSSFTSSLCSLGARGWSEHHHNFLSFSRHIFDKFKKLRQLHSLENLDLFVCPFFNNFLCVKFAPPVSTSSRMRNSHFKSM